MWLVIYFNVCWSCFVISRSLLANQYIVMQLRDARMREKHRMRSDSSLGIASYQSMAVSGDFIEQTVDLPSGF